MLQRFANEDHLSVHKQRHDMSLSLNPGLGGGKSTANLLFVGQYGLLVIVKYNL